MCEKYVKLVKSNNIILLNNNFFCDFTIKLQGEEIKCHKTLLYSGSEFFRAFFHFDPAQDEIVLNENIVSLSGVKDSLLFIYSLGCDFSLCEDKCEETYVAADFLQINALKSVASKQISRNINLLNAFGIIRFSVTYNDTSLKMNARNFINNNFNKLNLDNKEFLSLSFDVLSEIVSDKNLSSTDCIILKAVLKWVQYDMEGRREIIVRNIDKLVQLHLISTDQWNSLFQSSVEIQLREDLRTVYSSLNFYSDAQHRIGTPIVLYSVGSHRSDMLDWSNNFFYVDQTVDRLASMSEDRTNHKVCASSTFIFVIGGESSDGFIFKSCERYNIVEKRWESMAELDHHRTNFAVACLEGFVYLFGGRIVDDGKGGCAPSRDILVYDSGSDLWQKVKYRSPTNIMDAVAVGCSSYIYIAGGLDDYDHPVNKVSEFDPASGDWTPLNISGIPEEMFSVTNISTISLTAGGWTSENEGFLLLGGRVRDWTSVFVYHFSLNRWRLSITLEAFNHEFLTYKKLCLSCERDFIGLVCPATQSMLERYHLQEPATTTDSIDDELLLYVKFQITNDWSGELDMGNYNLCKLFSVRPGYQFLLSPLVPD